MHDKLLIKNAERWWNKIGRKVISKKANEERVDTRLPAIPGKAPAAIIRGSAATVYPSGILRGLEFDQLTDREQRRVIEVYREHFTSQQTEAGQAQKQRLKLN